MTEKEFLADLKDRDEPESPATPKTRTGAKQTQMIDLMKRPEGATVEQIAKTTGWQHRTVRGAVFGEQPV